MVISMQYNEDILNHGYDHNGVDYERQNPQNVFIVMDTIGEDA